MTARGITSPEPSAARWRTDVSKLYVDGAPEGTPGSGLTVGFQNTIPTGIGQATRASVQPFGVNGLVDEAHALQWPLTADWIKCEYNSQKPASTFYSFGNVAGGSVTNVAGNPTGTVTHSTGALTVNLPVLGNGGGDVKIGVAGQLVPAGGSTGQVLTKNSGTDYDDSWQAPTSGDVLVERGVHAMRDKGQRYGHRAGTNDILI